MVGTALVRIVVAEEQPIFRDGLRRLLETDEGIRIVGEAANARAAADLVRALEPDILLLSMGPSLTSPLDALECLSLPGVRTRTILLTGSVDTPAVMMAAIQLGAHGVVPKDSSSDVLFRSIDTVAAGHLWVGSECVSDLVTSVRRLESARRQTKAFGLTRRELEIVQSVLRGATNKDIACRFSISANTVKRHLTHIFDKVGASNRVELARFASHHGLMDSF